MSKNTDLRVVKTRKLIRTAFLQLIKEKGFEDITVNDLADRALINRSTFYLHYTDKYSLLDHIVADIIEKLMHFVEPEEHIRGNRLDATTLTRDIASILTTLAEDADFIKTVLVRPEMRIIRNRVFDTLKERFVRLVPEHTPADRDLLPELVTVFYLESVSWWLCSGTRYSAAHMAEQIVLFITQSFAQILGMEDVG